MIAKNSRLLFFIFLCIPVLLFSQSNQIKKTLNIKRSSHKAPKIDGILNDAAWKGLEVAKDFIMFQPGNGDAENPEYKTEVKVLYDDEAIYVSAMMYDPDPSKIAMQFTSRDNYGQADDFTLVLNPNNDGLNATQFTVMATGTQADAKVTNGREDHNWSAVWKSAAKVLKNGWSVEMMIPYAALRFSNQEVQTWGANFGRKIIRLNSQYSWNHIDNSIGIWTQYDGLLKGIRNINPPTRLSFYPYASTSVTQFDGNTDYNHNLGMDLKYGITENFTLDLTLVPDFGQTAFDNITLNLGPFEQRFNEQRQFFTEGTELFNKGRIFYSRRIGSLPSRFYEAYDNLGTNETVVDNPTKVNMLNALKISGRTKGGLGIGFFNAITNITKATIKKESIQNGNLVEEFYKKTTEPLTNYNMLVLDQQFNQNSSVTFINTSVLREGDFRDAYVSGLLYHVNNKKNTHFIDGYLKMSNLIENGVTETGLSFDTSIAKSAGNWQGEVGYNVENDKYNYNDFGFQRRNNNQMIYGNVSYRILKPKGRFNNFSINARYFSSYLYKPGIHTGDSYRLNVFANTRKRFSFGVNFRGNVGKTLDYFEARRPVSENRFLVNNPRISYGGFISTDFRKKFAFDLKVNANSVFNEDRGGYGFEFSPRYRFSNKLSFVYKFNYASSHGEIGYITNQNNDIILGKRDAKVYENTIAGKYSVGIKAALSLSCRPLWAAVTY